MEIESHSQLGEGEKARETDSGSDLSDPDIDCLVAGLNVSTKSNLIMTEEVPYEVCTLTDASV